MLILRFINSGYY